jgi:hypothetical protein
MTDGSGPLKSPPELSPEEAELKRGGRLCIDRPPLNREGGGDYGGEPPAGQPGRTARRVHLPLAALSAAVGPLAHPDRGA